MKQLLLNFESARPLRTHTRLLQLVTRPQFERLPEPAKKEVQKELEYRRAEGRAA